MLKVILIWGLTLMLILLPSDHYNFFKKEIMVYLGYDNIA
jgi:hypothetical protein